MKHRLTVLIAVAAFVAAPAVAFASTMSNNTMSSDPSPASGTTSIVVPHNSDASQALFSADLTYLVSRCPNVLSHPGAHSQMLNRFCADSHS